MNRLQKVGTAILIAAVATACVDRQSTPKQVEVDRAADAIAGDARSSGTLHELLPDPAGAEAFPLVAGSFITGSLDVPAGSRISAVAIQIGNYGNSAAGHVSIELCDEGKCSVGQQSLAGSVDNQYLEIALANPLDVQGDSALKYRFTKVDGEGPVALWTYPPTGSLPAVKVNDATDLGRVPKIALRF